MYWPFALIALLIYFILPAIIAHYLLKSNKISIKLIAIVPIFIIFSIFTYLILQTILQTGSIHLQKAPFIEVLIIYGGGAICIFFLLYKFIKKSYKKRDE